MIGSTSKKCRLVRFAFTNKMTYRTGIIGTGGIAGMGILGMHNEVKIGRENPSQLRRRV